MDLPSETQVWRSSTLDPYTVDEPIEQVPKCGLRLSSIPERSVTTIPASGWHGLFFFVQKEETESDEDRNNRREAKSGIASGEGSCRPRLAASSGLMDCAFSLWVETREESANARLIKLDLLLDGTKKDLALHVGRLYYLPMHSRVAVIVQRSNKTNLSNPLDEKPGATLKWFLAYRREINQQIADSNSAKPGDVPNCKKTIMCSFCWKRFPGIRPALDHWRQRHQPKDPEEVRKKPKGCYHNCPTNFPKTLTVVYQDNEMAIIDKPQGVAVMGSKPSLMRSDLLLSLAVWQAATNNEQTAVQKGNSATESSGATYLRKPVPAHRLDAGTGGLLVIAKTKEAERHLKDCFSNRRCRKRYRALLLGRLEPKEGIVDLPVSDQPAKTRYQVLDHHPSTYSKDGWISSVDLFPETGRRHQLRKHMKSLGHSIIGDRRYQGFLQLVGDGAATLTADSGEGRGSQPVVEPDPSSVMSRLCLWAFEISLPHPATKKEVTFAIDEPKWLHHVIRRSKQKRFD